MPFDARARGNNDQIVYLSHLQFCPLTSLVSGQILLPKNSLSFALSLPTLLSPTLPLSSLGLCQTSLIPSSLHAFHSLTLPCAVEVYH